MISTSSSCFNPRAHEGRDFLRPFGFPNFAVSIHAPTRGATSTRPQGSGNKNVSIHAPTRGATNDQFEYAKAILFQSTRPRGARRALGGLRVDRRGFNPRAHEGRDRRRRRKISFFKVSIHAPTRGATGGGGGRFHFSKFQSTRPRGARLVMALVAFPHLSFNPRAHEGRDPSGRFDLIKLLRFNPRAHEGRDFRPSFCQRNRMFQSTRPRGARHLTRSPGHQHIGFNPRAHEGRDFWWAILLRFSTFQSTRPRGARQIRLDQ